MNRTDLVRTIRDEREPWDLLIIGGGASGLGSAVDAASRGLKTLLLEAYDFAKGTSSRSTKLVHGGLRYLKQGQVHLVWEALHERGLLCQNAPHLVHPLPFLLPHYSWWERPFYGIGLTLYDLFSGKRRIGTSYHVSREEALTRLPTLQSTHLKGGQIYFDGQFDDARLAIDLALTFHELGGTLLNYAPVIRFLKQEGKLKGVVMRDEETGEEIPIYARAILNATGVFCDQIRHLDDPQEASIVTPSQGVHLVLDRSFFPSSTALIVPKTQDGRVLFFIPWHNHLLIGTTDTPIAHPLLEPRPLAQEVSFLLDHAKLYLTHAPTFRDVRSVYAGLRPLIKDPRSMRTAALSRDHHLFVSSSGLITLTGGKWTTYRKMGEDAVDRVLEHLRLDPRPCKTAHLRIRAPSPLLMEEPMHPRLPYRKGEVIRAVREEMARTVEDVLARRTRALFLDATAAVELAPLVAKLMAEELHYSPSWEATQVDRFTQIAAGYRL